MASGNSGYTQYGSLVKQLTRILNGETVQIQPPGGSSKVGQAELLRQAKAFQLLRCKTFSILQVTLPEDTVKSVGDVVISDGAMVDLTPLTLRLHRLCIPIWP